MASLEGDTLDLVLLVGRVEEVGEDDPDVTIADGGCRSPACELSSMGRSVRDRLFFPGHVGQQTGLYPECGRESKTFQRTARRLGSPIHRYIYLMPLDCDIDRALQRPRLGWF